MGCTCESWLAVPLSKELSIAKPQKYSFDFEEALGGERHVGYCVRCPSIPVHNRARDIRNKGVLSTEAQLEALSLLLAIGWP